MNNSRWHELVKKHSDNAGIDSNIVYALIRVESDWNPWHVRIDEKCCSAHHPEKHGPENRISIETERRLQAYRWGWMAVPGWVARQMGFEGPLQQLCGPEYNLEYGCLILADFIRRMDHREAYGLSAYSVGRSFDGTKILNEKYVTRILEKLFELRGSKSLKNQIQI
jgi:hypothetical protein